MNLRLTLYKFLMFLLKVFKRVDIISYLLRIELSFLLPSISRSDDIVHYLIITALGTLRSGFLIFFFFLLHVFFHSVYVFFLFLLICKISTDGNFYRSFLALNCSHWPVFIMQIPSLLSFHIFLLILYTYEDSSFSKLFNLFLPLVLH